MNEDELIALLVYAGAGLIALALYMRRSIQAMRWIRRSPPQLR
jgi:hypothetical protein